MFLFSWLEDTVIAGTPTERRENQDSRLRHPEWHRHARKVTNSFVAQGRARSIEWGSALPCWCTRHSHRPTDSTTITFGRTIHERVCPQRRCISWSWSSRLRSNPSMNRYSFVLRPSSPEKLAQAASSLQSPLSLPADAKRMECGGVDAGGRARNGDKSTTMQGMRRRACSSSLVDQIEKKESEKKKI